MGKREMHAWRLWTFMFSYLPLNDMIEASCVWKDFYRLSRIDSFFMKKLTVSRKIFKDTLWIASCYTLFCDTFYYTLFRKVVPYVSIDQVLKARKTILNKLIYDLLPFRVWNHLWMCVRSKHEKKHVLDVYKNISKK